MSEADSPKDQPASASINPSDPLPEIQGVNETVETTDEEGWQTVAFPGAMSIDALSQHSALPPISLGTFGEAVEPGVIHYGSAELDPATTALTMASPEGPDKSTLQHLQEENAALRARLAQAELDLVQHQIEWQLEAACSQADPTAGGTIDPATEQPSSVELTSEHLHQLLQELERSQQITQRQQILVKTLTEQLESSQERIAQLERDCALTQQRHNEQVQQVLQAESICRDLRLRLHRQQQQTLQFKAALEKCLEMPTVYSQQPLSEAFLDDSTTAPHPLSALLKPTNQPVKPWSQPSDITPASSDQSVLPKPLFKLLNQGNLEQGHTDAWQESEALTAKSFCHEDNEGHSAANSVEPTTLLDSDDPQFVAHLMQLMFPEAVEGHTYPGTAALEADVAPAEPIFGLNPFLEAEPPVESQPSLEGDQSETTVPQTREVAAIAPLVLPEAPSAEPRWRDGDAFIDPSLVTPNSTMTLVEGDATPVASTQASSGRGAIPPLSAARHPALPPTSAPASTSAPVTVPADQSAQSLNAWTWRDRLNSPNKSLLGPAVEPVGLEETKPEEADLAAIEPGAIAAKRTTQPPSKLLSLSTIDRRSAVKQTISVSNQTTLAAAVAAPPPSPLVYPLRSSKKLASLAAVDLPTFPKR